MGKNALKQLPVGIQTFEKIVKGDYLYIDKTEYVWKMTRLSNYIFLSRPRRFGKSLLVSTLSAYFEGRKELFKGLYIDSVEKEWIQYPVLHLSMASAKHLERAQLERYLISILEEKEKSFGITSSCSDPNIRFKNLISAIYIQTGQPVVVLIDEYDAPLLDVVHRDAELTELRNVMRNFYSPLKDCDSMLKFVFITGITKFSQVSIFSELNNLKNISMLPDFDAICGITTNELTIQMGDYIADVAEYNNITPEETISKLKQQYDGYHFTMPSADIFNPFSLLNAVQDRAFANYWFSTGTPTYLVEMMRKFSVVPSDLSEKQAMSYEFDAPTESMTNILPLLYQAGYLTIKDYDPELQLYTLDLPNKEIRVGLMECLLGNYVNPSGRASGANIALMYKALKEDNLDLFFQHLQTFLHSIPQCDNTNYEGHYQQLLYVIFSLLGRYADVEVRTPRGRVDMVLRTDKVLYVIELKMNKSASEALSQISLKDYPARFALCGLPVVRVGVSFDSQLRNVQDWAVET